VLGVGPEALERRREALRPLTDILRIGQELAPAVPEVGLDLIAGGINGLAYRQIRDHGPETLSSLAPVATYLALAPFLGSEAACEAANGDGRGQGRPDPLSADERETARVLQFLEPGRDSGGSSVADLSEGLGMAVEDVERHLRVLQEAELAEVAAERPGEGRVERFYRAHLTLVQDAAWAAMDQAQREKVSKQIGLLIMGNVLASVESGLFDTRPDRHLSRVGVEVDAEGWRRLMDLHDETLYAVLAEVKAARQRLEASGEQPIRGYSVQTMFEGPVTHSPKDNDLGEGE
jgi:DNA-binding transcriptional ArsR family regulator